MKPPKPAYRVPSMAEIAAVPLNGYRVASTFSGCGGSSLGYRMAGFKVVWANEFIAPAQEVYRANFRDTWLDPRDIRQVEPKDILEAAGLQVGELDLLDGSPPCASFSMAGKRQRGWGEVKNYSAGRKQRTEDLFFEYARLVKGLQPRVFVAENVSGLVKGAGKGYFLEILAALKAAGYRVRAQLLDAQWLGVPQARQRLFFVGVRSDLDAEPAFPAPKSFRYSVRDALPWIGSVSEPEADMRRFAVGRELDKLGQGEQSGRYFQLTRASLAEPSPTITARGQSADAASVAHPTECRKFSIAELRRVCAFPDDFVLTGTYREQWERLGRAVPPVMMAAIAETIRDRVLGPAARRKGADCSAPLRKVAA